MNECIHACMHDFDKFHTLFGGIYVYYLFPDSQAVKSGSFLAIEPSKSIFLRLRVFFPNVLPHQTSATKMLPNFYGTNCHQCATNPGNFLMSPRQ